MSAEEGATMSKSARKRANQKARAAEAAEEAPPPAPEPAPKSKAAAKKAAAPAPEPKAQPAPEAKASAKGKAKAKAEPKAAEPPAPVAKAEAKAKAKGKAEPKPAEPKAAAEPQPAQPKSKAASKKAAAKAKAQPEPEEPVKAAAAGPLAYYEIDDGTRSGDWEVSSGLSRQAQKRKEKAAEKAQEDKERAKAGVVEAKGNQHIPGLAPAEVQVAQASGKKSKTGAKEAANQLVTAMASVTAAAVAAKAQEQEKSAAAAAPDNSVSVSIKVPEPKIGRVVGPKGSNVTLIKEKCGVKTIDMSGDMCTIVGPPDGVVLAEAAVRQLIEKGYMAIAYDDFEEEGVPVLPTSFPDLIGKGGAIIQVIKKEAKVEIDIPAVPKTPPPGKKYKVNVAGSKAGVTLAKEIIESIATYGHHEVTHPGQTHQEMEVEEWRYRYLIGSKGSEMRHIQNNYKVKVNIPREHSACQNVCIVGETRDVERALKYIEKILYEADQPKGRGATDQATDNWGDEGEVEDWMKPYMYQRK